MYVSDHVMQNRTMVIRGYPSSDFIPMDGKTRNKQMFKLTFNWSRKTKKDVLQEPVTAK